jgi:hypothetical protein
MRGLRGNTLEIGQNRRQQSAKDSRSTENLVFAELSFDPAQAKSD